MHDDFFSDFAGGDAVILYACKYHDLPVMVNLSSPCFLKSGMEEVFGKDIWDKLKKDGSVDANSKTGCLIFLVVINEPN